MCLRFHKEKQLPENPFSPLCEKYAKEFDWAIDNHNHGKIKMLIESALESIDSNDSSFAPMYYYIGNGLISIRDDLLNVYGAQSFAKNNEIIDLHRKALKYYRDAERLLDLIDRDNIYVLTQRKVVYVNLANALEQSRRKCSAIHYYSKALSIDPTFGMALGNIGIAYEDYASLEGDPGHRATLIRKAYEYFCLVENHNDPNTPKDIKKHFLNEKIDLEKQFGIEALRKQLPYYEDDYSIEERNYRNWCLNNHLFLNTLNDLNDSNHLFACDPLHVRSFLTSFEQANPPWIFEMINIIKEEFIYARLSLYESSSTNGLPHFADKYTHLLDTLNYSNYAIRIEKTKSAFSSLYAILDQVSFIINRYFELGIADDRVSYYLIFKQPKLLEKEINNYGLWALHWIYRDFYKENGDSTPYVDHFKEIRNALEHRFLSVHNYSLEGELIITKSGIDRVTDDCLLKDALQLARIIREVIIELIIAISIEEITKNDSTLSMPIVINEVDDEFKV